MHQTPQVGERLELARIAHHVLVALGVRDHRQEAAFSQIFDGFFGADRDLSVGQFEQHDPLAAPRAEGGKFVLSGEHQRFGQQADFSTERHVQRQVARGEHRLEGGEGLAQGGCCVVPLTGENVRGKDGVADAVGHGGSGECDRFFDSAGAVVDEGQQVAMQIDHGASRRLKPAGCTRRGQPRGVPLDGRDEQPPIG